MDARCSLDAMVMFCQNDYAHKCIKYEHSECHRPERSFFWVDISKLPLTVAALVITVPFGLTAVVIGHFTTSFICFFINAYYPGKMFGFGAVRQIREMGRVICATLIMSVIVFVSSILFAFRFFKTGYWCAIRGWNLSSVGIFVENWRN